MSEPTALDRAWQLLYRTAYPVARLWWRIRRKPHRGALVAISVEGALLLVRSSYRAEWSLPGGGVETGERPAEAARRELREELGLAITVGDEAVVVTGAWDGRPETVAIFEVRLPAPPALRLDQREVIGARYFPPAELAGLRLSGPAIAYLALRSAVDGEPAAGAAGGD